MQFPEYFAGEAETVVDLGLNPIPIVYGDPQEDDPAKWETPSSSEGLQKRPAGEAEIADIIRQGKLK